MNFALNPQWRLRPDRNCVLFYKTSETQIGEYRYVHPSYAVTMVLFDGEKSSEDVAEILSYINGMDLESTVKFVENFLSKNSEYLLEASRLPLGSLRKYDPLKFVMNIEDVNLSKKRLIAPLSLLMLVTIKCRTNCIYCYAERNEEEEKQALPLSRINEIISEAAELGVSLITFSGGDPFMRKDFIDILEHTINMDIVPATSTKCALSEAQIEKLAKIGLERLQISLDSPEPATADFLTKTHNYLDSMIPVIQNLVKAGIKVETNSVVMPYNVYQVPELVEKLVGLGVSCIRITPYARSHYRHSDSLFLSSEEVKWLDEALKEPIEKYSDIINYSGGANGEHPMTVEEKVKVYANRAHCTAGTQALVIHHDGKVTLCEELPSTSEYIVGDLSRQSISDVWNSECLMELIIPTREKFIGQVCYDCLDFYECHAYKGRCIRDALKAYGTPYATSPRCPYAPPALRL